MSFRDQYDFDSLVNEAERRVIDELERQTEGLGAEWTNEECLLDMAAYALNRIEPRYRATLLGKVYATADDPPYAAAVSAAVAQAIETVMGNPPHRGYSA